VSGKNPIPKLKLRLMVIPKIRRIKIVGTPLAKVAKEVVKTVG
jgi:hypothetical protein